MGCESSKAEKVPQMKFTTPSEPNFGRKAGLDPKDFIFSKRQKETLIKNPSQIDGQQFIVEECEGCEIFLLDHIGSLTVDYCKDCRIVTGPVSSRCEDYFAPKTIL
jgi:protein XRP2